MPKFLKLFLKGFCIGTANAIPGVSGGTMAFILGIYEELILAIKAFDLTFVKNVVTFQFKKAIASIPCGFLAAVFSGAICAIILLSRIIVWCLENKAVYIDSFFFGLILATIPIIARIIKKWDLTKGGVLILSAAGMFILSRMVPLETPSTYSFIFMAGVISICSMILPGISGAYILVLLGKYQYILDAVNRHDMIILGVFLAGAVIGITAFVRVLSWLFSKFHDITLAILTGIVLGSLGKIWPWRVTIESVVTSKGALPLHQALVLPRAVNAGVLIALGFMFLGVITAIMLNQSPSDSKTINVS